MDDMPGSPGLGKVAKLDGWNSNNAVATVYSTINV